MEPGTIRVRRSQVADRARLFRRSSVDVHEISNLILNINLQVREVATGRLIQAGTVDIRGNTDESWRRGLRYLLERRIFRE